MVSLLHRATIINLFTNTVVSAEVSTRQQHWAHPLPVFLDGPGQPSYRWSEAALPDGSAETGRQTFYTLLSLNLH